MAASNAHSQRLFVDLVSASLRDRMSGWGDVDYDDAVNFAELPFNLPDQTIIRVERLEIQMQDVAKTMHDMSAKIDAFISVQSQQQPVFPLPHHSVPPMLPPITSQSVHHLQQQCSPHQLVLPQHHQLPPQQFVLPPYQQFPQQLDLPQHQQLPQQQWVQPQQQQLSPQQLGQNQHSPAVPVFQAASPKSSSPLSPSAAHRFDFTCPLCTRVQYTPKSHVNHLRKAAETGSDVSHYCTFRSDIKFHTDVAAVWGNLTAFVNWYCGPFRSGMGSNFSEQDMDTFRSQQAAMLSAVSRGSL